jgi:hypothetical protein
MKYTETYLERIIETSDNDAVLKADVSDSKEILVLKTELAERKAAQATVTTTQGQGAAHRLYNKRRHDGGAHTADKSVVDVYKTCGNRHPGRPCWKEGDKKRAQVLTLLQETESILSTRKSNNKPSNLDSTALESVVVSDQESNQ